MTVKKKLNLSIENFIDKGADVKTNNEKKFKNVLIRIPLRMLTQIQRVTDRKPWYTRTQWILEAMHEKLQKEE